MTDDVKLKMEIVQSLTEPCDRHNVRFLAKCINCGTAFLIPSQWEVGECQHCGLEFEKMTRHQNKLKNC